MIVENHGLKRGQEAQSDTLRLSQSSNRPVQRGVKHDLSDPHARENEHLEQEAVQGLEHMVMADHGPKKGMAPQFKPQFKPLFFPFAMCLPTFSTPQDHDLKEGHNVTLKAHSQSSPMGRESNDNRDKQKLSHQESSTIDAMSTSPTQSELTSPWPDQWWLEGLSDDMTDLEDPWPDLEGTNDWNNASNKEELNLTDDAPYVTPWGLFGEPQWITELNNAIELEPEKDPFPLVLHQPDKDNEWKSKGELSPQKSNEVSDQKEILSVQSNQCDKEILDQGNPGNESQSANADNNGTTDMSPYQTYQSLKCPTLDDKEGTTIVKSTQLNTSTLPWDKDDAAVDNTIRGRNPHCLHKLIKSSNMTQLWMTQPQSAAHQPEWDRSMMPLLQTSAHYPKTSKQNDRSSSDQCFRTLSESLIQEHADSAKTSLSAMTYGTDSDQSKTPSSNDRRPEKHTLSLTTRTTRTDQSIVPPSPDQKRTALTILGIIVTAILTIVQGNQRHHDTTNRTLDKAVIVTSAKEQMQRTTQDAECPKCGHWMQERPLYKSPPRNATNSSLNSPILLSTPTTPNNTLTTSPCPPPSLIPLLQLRSEDSGSKERLTTNPGKATMSSIHGGATMTAVIPGTVAKQWIVTKITLRTKTITATLGTPVKRWEAAKVVLPMIPRPLTITLMTKTTSNKQGRMSPHHRTSLVDKSMQSSTMSSPTLPANNSPTTPHSKCWGNASLSMILCASASTYVWMALHNDSLGRSKLLTSIMWTWRNFSTTWNGTYAQKVSSTHSTKAAALQSPIPLSMNKEPRSLGPYLANGNNKVNATGQQQQPSTYARGRKPLPSTYSFFKMTGLPPPHFITCSGDSTSHNPKTLSGGKYFDKTTLYTTRSSTLKDTHTQTTDSMLGYVEAST